MHPRLSSFANQCLYQAGVLAGYVGLAGSLAFSWAMRAFGRTFLGRQVFVLGSLSRIKPKYLALMLVPLTLLINRFVPVSDTVAFSAAGLSFLCILFDMRVGRVLSICNKGGGRWELHLNARKRREESAMQLVGAATEMSELATMAAASGVQVLAFDSPLLACEDTARRFTDKLVQLFSARGIRVNVGFSESRRLSPFQSGLHRPLRSYQAGLKAHRVVFNSPAEILTRRIELQLAQA